MTSILQSRAALPGFLYFYFVAFFLPISFLFNERSANLISLFGEGLDVYPSTYAGPPTLYEGIEAVLQATPPS